MVRSPLLSGVTYCLLFPFCHKERASDRKAWIAFSGVVWKGNQVMIPELSFCLWACNLSDSLAPTLTLVKGRPLVTRHGNSCSSTALSWGKLLHQDALYASGCRSVTVGIYPGGPNF